MFSFAKHSKHSWVGRSSHADSSSSTTVGLDVGSEVGSETAVSAVSSFSAVPHARNKVLIKIVRLMVLSPLIVKVAAYNRNQVLPTIEKVIS